MSWREFLGLTQKEVAKRMGITQAALSQMESAENNLRKETLKKLATALKLDIAQLQE
jgi:transcriptional regulator with XRE-family HTH domain